MTSFIERQPDAPIILARIPPGRHALDVSNAYVSMTLSLVSEQPEPVFLVIDLREVVMRFDDISKAADNAARGSGSLLHHPNLRETIVVTHSSMMKTALQILTSQLFGETRLSTANSLDEALAYCQDQLRNTASS